MNLKEKFQNLEVKEQRALTIGAIAILCFILYQFVYQPFDKALTNVQKQLEYQQNLNNWLKSIEPKLQALSKQPTKQPLAFAKLLSTTSMSLKQTDLKTHPYELQQNDTNSIQLNFKRVPYTEFMHWMDEFWQKYPLSIKEITVSALNTPGMVSINIRFGLSPQ